MSYLIASTSSKGDAIWTEESDREAVRTKSGLNNAVYCINEM
jgi:hypothetical protein